MRRVVVKIGSSVLADADGLGRARIRALAGEIAALVAAGRADRRGQLGRGRRRRSRGSAGARGRARMAAGRGRRRAAGLMAAYERAFRRHGRTVAQVLLTHADLADRRRYLNARHTLRALLALGAVPIVNENDTVAVEELKFGDNDNLSALTASLVEADLLVILSDVAGLYERRSAAATRAAPLVPLARAGEAARRRRRGTGAQRGVGTGGMASKLDAARKAAAAGIPTVIAARRPARRARRRSSIPRTEIGTLLLADGDPLARRKHWIAHALRPAGTLHLDAVSRLCAVDAWRSCSRPNSKTIHPAAQYMS